MSSKTENHINAISNEVDKMFVVAEKARAKGLDPSDKVETSIAISLAEKSVGLISVIYPQLKDKRIVDRILELEEKYGQLTMSVSLGIAEDIAKQKFCSFDSQLQAIEAGVRVGFAYTTLGVVSSPIEGLTEIRTGQTRNGKEYLKVFFSGPIRSAGTTATCVVLMIIDYLRELFDYAKYDPNEDEVQRYVTENYDYHDWVTNLQYLPTEAEIQFLASRMPIQLCGEPTEKREVSNYKDLERVETDNIRGGMCLAFSEGLAQKAQKGLRLLKAAQENGYKTEGWNFLDDYLELRKKQEKGKGGKGGGGVPVYIKDLVAGRPVFGHPGASGGFRFRYGRAPTGGFSATSVHPATMALTDDFISYGTQLKIEKPTKGTAVSMCDTIDGPIVKLRNGSVQYVENYDQAQGLYKDVEEILYLGDLLVSFDDVANRNYDLIKPGFVEEWWGKELEKAAKDKGEEIKVDPWKVSFLEAQDYSKRYGIPLHPRYIFYWTQIKYEDFLALLDWLARGNVKEGKLVLPYGQQDRDRFKKAKRALEIIGCTHEVSLENAVIPPEYAEPLLYNLSISSGDGKLESLVDSLLKQIPKDDEVLKVVQSLCAAYVKDKAGDFVGSRMGRPEKAKLRKLQGSPHVLFPVAAEGGRLRSVQEAVDVGYVNSEFPLYTCKSCSNNTIYPTCEKCGEKCARKYYCYQCRKEHETDYCEEHDRKLQGFSQQKIDVKHYFDMAKKQTGIRIEELPVAVKGVKGTSNEDHSTEHMGKGLLRAKYNLHVNKDGTIRYDMTEMPLSHFKPVEIGTSVEKLRELGYTEDVEGKPLENEEQVLEMLPHDIVLPSCETSGDEKAEDVFLNVSKFIDDELELLYGLPRYYNAKTKHDLIGSLFGCIAPHICVAVVGRLIGFSKVQPMLASQFMHAAMRRDCDGDEAAVIFLMDILLNFSRKFLPAHRGGTQDAPLVLVSKINAGEVDDQILDAVVGEYPLELYHKAEERKHSSEIKLEMVSDRLREHKDPFINMSYTHGCSNLNNGVTNSAYKSLPTMTDKVGSQMNLCVKIRAVDTADVARLTIERHFIRDTRGNLRKFSMQTFRCVGCNDKYRRPPLSGKCTSCGGKLLFTITHGSIIKYLDKALHLGNTYGVSSYLKECLDLVQRDVDSIFGKEKEKQEALNKWFG